MKRLSTALVATALLALAACGSRTANNAAALDNTSDYFNVTSDDLTSNDVGNASGNGSSSGNASAGNASGGATSNASGNSH